MPCLVRVLVEAVYCIFGIYCITGISTLGVCAIRHAALRACPLCLLATNTLCMLHRRISKGLGIIRDTLCIGHGCYPAQGLAIGPGTCPQTV